MAARNIVSGEVANSSVGSSIDPLKTLYPAVNEEETPLPRSWSPKDKYNYIGLSLNNLRVHYKGVGKSHNHKDAAGVRATYPIPAACGIYYFEIRIVSKGRDGYMGIGLSTQGVSTNKLPGWEKYSYGYHGDDGNAFCSSNPGIPYGPTFTTGDIVGCCVNLIDSTCFYTKNGIKLGLAFSDLPANLYPTVGLQTPGEVVEANFGQSPFVFDITEYVKEWRMKTKLSIERFPVSDRRGEWQQTLQRMISTYLVHHSYCSTAEAFSCITAQSIEEDIPSIRHRQRIQDFVLSGRMGEAISLTQQLYPGLLEHNPNLLFMLKCRQFVEMVKGDDSEVRVLSPTPRTSPRSYGSSRGSSRSSPNLSPAHITSTTISNIPSSNFLHHHPHHVQQQQQQALTSSRHGSSGSSPVHTPGKHSRSSTPSSPSPPSYQHRSVDIVHRMSPEEMKNAANLSPERFIVNGSGPVILENDEMDTDDGCVTVEEKFVANGNICSTVLSMNGSSFELTDLSHGKAEDMDVDQGSEKQLQQLCGGNRLSIERMLQFGRELQTLSQQLRREFGYNDSNKRAIQDAFSLLAYPNPWSSPVGFQLHPVQREPVCAALNSAILESHGLPRQPPLQLAISQAMQCMKLMAKAGIGACAFASLSDYIH